jgi:hypothetical protein
MDEQDPFSRTDLPMFLRIELFLRLHWHQLLVVLIITVYTLKTLFCKVGTAWEQKKQQAERLAMLRSAQRESINLVNPDEERLERIKQARQRQQELANAASCRDKAEQEQRKRDQIEDMKVKAGLSKGRVLRSEHRRIASPPPAGENHYTPLDPANADHGYRPSIQVVSPR